MSMKNLPDPASDPMTASAASAAGSPAADASATGAASNSATAAPTAPHISAAPAAPDVQAKEDCETKAAKEPKPGPLAALRFLGSILRDRKKAAVYVTLVALGRLMPPVGAWALTLRVNEAAQGAREPAWMLALGGVAAVYALSMMTDWGLRVAGQWIFYPLSSRLGTRFCDLALRGLLAQDAGAIAAKSEASWAAQLSRKNDVATLVSFTFNHLAPPTLEAVYAMAALWALSRDATLFFVAAGGVGIWAAVSVRSQEAIAKAARKLLRAQTNVGDSTAGCARAALLAKVFGAQEFLLAQRGLASQAEIESYSRARLAQVAAEAVQGLILAASLSACFWIGSRGLAAGAMGPGAFAASMGLVAGCFWQLRNLGYAISGVASCAGNLADALPLAREGLKIEQEQGREQSGAAGLPGSIGAAATATLAGAPAELWIEGLGFAEKMGDEHGGQEPDASGATECGAAEAARGPNRAGEKGRPLARVSVKAGEKVFLVGLSGAGKTTLATRVLGLRSWPDGASSNAQAWEGHWGWAPQSAPLVPGSLWENIAMGRASRQEAIEAAKACELDGRDWDAPAAESLSGGEKLRLATARALCSGRAGLVLDEPTAGLDATRERLLMKRLLASPQTMILITHRLNAIPPEATIWVLRRGAVVEIGKAKELLATPNSEFARLFDDFHHNRLSASSAACEPAAETA
jgi:ABC-type multidrug transport system fused ATPase/permease subunit